MNLAQISIIVIFISSIAVLTGEEVNNFIVNDFRSTLAPYLIPIFYKISLTAYFVRKTIKPTRIQLLTMDDPEIFNETYFNGTTNIMINIVSPTKCIKLHTQAINIERSSIRLIETHKMIHSPKEMLYSAEENILNLDFTDVISPGFYTLKIVTTSRISNYQERIGGAFVNTNYWSQDPDDMWSIAPNIQDIGARKLFPCWDEPHLKSKFLISVRHNPFCSVISNMPIRDTIKEFHSEDVITKYIQWTVDGNTKWTHFYPTPPISTHQVVIFINRMNKPNIVIPNMTIRCTWRYCNERFKYRKYDSLKYHMYLMDKLRLHMEKEFKGIKFPKIDHIIIPDFPHNTTPKWGVVFHSVADIIYDNKPDRFMRKIEFERRLAYRMAHQWFGYPVSSSWWSNFWLHDGLAMFFAEDAIAKMHNDSQLMNLFIVKDQYDSLNLDSYYNLNLPLINTLSDFESLLNFPHYIKVIVVLRMLQNIVTDKVFRSGIHTYLNKHTSNSANISDFWSIQENLAKESYPYGFISWLAYEHYPIISWKYKNPNVIKLEQYCDLSSRNKWFIPINIETKNSFPGKTKLWLTREMHYTHFYHVPFNKLITLNSQQAGHYRVYYDPENWLNIANHLNSGKYEDMNVVNRARFIDDAFHMVLDHQLNGSVFWNLAKYLSQETDYVAWYPMIKAFEYISTVFPLSKDDGTNFTRVKKNIAELLDKPLVTLGFEERPRENNLTKCLRQDVLRWACAAENTKCLNIAFNKLEEHLQEPALFTLSPGWREWTFCRGSITVDKTNPLQHITKEWKDKINLEYAAHNFCFQDTETIRVLLSSINKRKSVKNRSEEDIIKLIRIYFYAIIKYAKNEEILKDILKKDIRPTEIAESTALIMIINNVYSPKVVYKIGNMLKEQQSLQKIESRIQHKIRTRVSELERHIDHFRMFLN